MLLRHKKGSHVGMVLSFVLFISFLSFIYMAMEPAISIEPGKASLLEYLRKEITLQASDTLISATVTNAEDPAEGCWIIDHSAFVDSSMGYSDMGYIVKNKNNEIVGSEIYALGLDQYTFLDSGGQYFFKLYYSKEDFSNTPINHETTCDQYGEYQSQYFLGLVTSKQEVFERKIIRMIEEHEENYYSLKRDLKIPFDSDFSFSFVLSNGTEIATGEQEVSVSVFAGEYPVKYVDKEANLKFGTLKVKLW